MSAGGSLSFVQICFTNQYYICETIFELERAEAKMSKKNNKKIW